jgi:hypothetical protein
MVFIHHVPIQHYAEAPLLEQLTKNDLVKMVQLYKQDVQNAQNEKEKYSYTIA